MRRELTLAVRDPGLRLALFGYLAAFLVAVLPLYLGAVGSERITSETMEKLLSSRLTAVQWVLACALAPWAMLRIGGPEPGGALAPWRVVLSRWAVGYLFLLQLLIAALPAVLLACVVSGAPPAAILGSAPDLALFLGLVGLAVFHRTLSGRPGLSDLGLAYLTLLVLAAGRWALVEAAGPAAAAAAVAAAALGLGGWLVHRSSGRLLYLDDGT